MKFALVLTHDVEDRRGLEKCLNVARMERDLGFTSSFNFVPKKYHVPPEVRRELVDRGFEVGVHDLRHDGNLFESEETFLKRVREINGYLNAWNAVGFRAGSMYHNLDWIHAMQIEYDLSTFDTDPFEPQPEGVHTIFPFWVQNPRASGGYVELPYTLPQDITGFVLLRNRDTRLWEEKLAWVAKRGGMALLDSHPDYMQWPGAKRRIDEYPFELYRRFLEHVKSTYAGQYWNALPRDVARYWKSCIGRNPA